MEGNKKVVHDFPSLSRVEKKCPLNIIDKRELPSQEPNVNMVLYLMKPEILTPGYPEYIWIYEQLHLLNTCFKPWLEESFFKKQTSHTNIQIGFKLQQKQDLLLNQAWALDEFYTLKKLESSYYFDHVLHAIPFLTTRSEAEKTESFEKLRYVLQVRTVKRARKRKSSSKQEQAAVPQEEEGKKEDKSSGLEPQKEKPPLQDS